MSVLALWSLDQNTWRWTPLRYHPVLMAPVLARQFALKKRGQMLRKHILGRRGRANARTNKPNSPLLTNRVFVLWSRML